VPKVQLDQMGSRVILETRDRLEQPDLRDLLDYLVTQASKVNKALLDSLDFVV